MKSISSCFCVSHQTICNLHSPKRCQMTGFYTPKPKDLIVGAESGGILEFVSVWVYLINHSLCTLNFAFHIAVQFTNMEYNFFICFQHEKCKSSSVFTKQVLGQFLPMGCSLVTPDQSDLYIVPIV